MPSLMLLNPIDRMLPARFSVKNIKGSISQGYHVTRTVFLDYDYGDSYRNRCGAELRRTLDLPDYNDGIDGTQPDARSATLNPAYRRFRNDRYVCLRSI
jgi:hypothetical protein